MIEAEWDASRNPRPMLEALGAPPARKLRLFARACCARIDHLIADPRSRAALEFADKHFGAPVNKQKGRTKVLKDARAAWTEAYNEMFRYTDERSARCLVRSCAADTVTALFNSEAELAARYASSFACYAVAWGVHADAGLGSRGTTITDDEQAGEFAAQADLMRCVFANPFREVRFDPAWRTDTAVALAKHADASNDFGAMPILADALQDAGCEDEVILNHCRDVNQVHVRGCWVCDLVLGKS